MLDHVIDGFVQVSFCCFLAKNKISRKKKIKKKVCQPKFIFLKAQGEKKNLNQKNCWKKSGVDSNNPACERCLGISFKKSTQIWNERAK